MMTAERPPKHRYAAPKKSDCTDLRSILSRSERGRLEPKQYSLLDKGRGDDARSMPIFYAGDLSLVEKPAIDIHAKWRAEIEARDWSRVHIIGDRNPPLELDDRPRRGWR